MLCVPSMMKAGSEEASRPLLTVTVLFTDVMHTLSALRRAAILGRSLHASLRILMPIVVPYPLALSESPVDSRILQRRLTTIAEGTGIPTRIHVVYSRDRDEAVKKCLTPNSVIVMGFQRRWLFDRTASLARKLTKLGHQVIAA